MKILVDVARLGGLLLPPVHAAENTKPAPLARGAAHRVMFELTRAEPDAWSNDRPTFARRNERGEA